jgi:predicted XRE-type DNA-binding protein
MPRRFSQFEARGYKVTDVKKKATETHIRIVLMKKLLQLWLEQTDMAR